MRAGGGVGDRRPARVQGCASAERGPPAYPTGRDANFAFPMMRQVTLRGMMVWPRELEDGGLETLHLDFCNGFQLAVSRHAEEPRADAWGPVLPDIVSVEHLVHGVPQARALFQMGDDPGPGKRLAWLDLAAGASGYMSSGMISLPAMPPTSCDCDYHGSHDFVQLPDKADG
eukprot:jgi/Chlat1/160/Chrsp1S03102